MKGNDDNMWEVLIGWYDDLNFDYVYPEKKRFDNKNEAEEYAKFYTRSGFNVILREIK